MCRNAKLRRRVHLARADLHLNYPAVARKHGGMEALVAGGLGEGDIVFNFIGERLPEVVYYPEYAVAVGHRVDHDADRGNVVDVVDVAAFALELLPEAP